MRESLLQGFASIYGDTKGARIFFAPGRVNLIGEHTDYNGGHVFPCALTIGTYGVVRKISEKVFRFYSWNFKELGVVEIPMDSLVYREEDGWTNYPKGVIEMFRQEGMVADSGFEIFVYGNIPNRSGLSSSASLEVLTGEVLRELYDFEIDNLHIALLGQKAENIFNGVNCGIMDQFAIAMGKKDHAMFLNTATLEFEYAPIELKYQRIVIACTNKKRGLADSKYNERREECELALKQLQTVVDIETLGDLTNEEFDKYQSAITDEIQLRRARHAVRENQRTIQAVEALKKNDLKTFGQLMNESHKSLRDDYEVTGKELDTLVESAWKQKGVLGARMTGAGFGGCTVNIVEENCIEQFIETVGKEYEEKIGYKADFYVVAIGDGPRELQEGEDE